MMVALVMSLTMGGARIVTGTLSCFCPNVDMIDMILCMLFSDSRQMAGGVQGSKQTERQRQWKGAGQELAPQGWER
jgi:hypothetical protein